MSDAAITTSSVFGDGVKYSGNARLFSVRRDDFHYFGEESVATGEWTIAVAGERLLDADKPLALEPVLETLALDHLDELQAAAGFPVVEMEEFRGPNGEVESRPAWKNELVASLFDFATCGTLLAALHFKEHGLPDESTGREWDERDYLIPAEGTQRLLLKHGYQAIRFTDAFGEMESGTFFCVLDPRAIQRPHTPSFSLDFPKPDDTAQASNIGWSELDEEARQAVQAAVGLHRRECVGQHPFQGTSIWTIPHPSGGITWMIEGVRPAAVGTHVLPCDAPELFYDREDVAKVQAAWAQIGDLDAALQDPERAKELLAAANWQRTAAVEWLNSERPMSSEIEIAEELAPLVEEFEDRRFRIHVAVAQLASNEEWARRFDAAGWPDAHHQVIASDLPAYLLELGELFQTHLLPEPEQQAAHAAVAVEMRSRSR